MWIFAGSALDGEKFLLSGLNVWDHKWHDIGTSGASIKDPHYHQDFVFDVYSITAEGRTITFAAGEFSNMVWGFYVPGDAADAA